MLFSRITPPRRRPPAARVGLTCDLILTRMVARDDEHYARSGNMLLDRLLGATVHVVDDADEALTLYVELEGASTADGRSLFMISPGGSDATGALGYVAAAIELAEQSRSRRIDLTRVFVAASTTGTAAGLILGASLAGLDALIDIACVYEPAPVTESVLRTLIGAGADVLGCDPPDDSRWIITDDTLGPGYGIPTPDGRQAMDVLARTEGIFLDPVYTAKAFAHMLGWIERDELAADTDVVFVHTGARRACSPTPNPLRVQQPYGLGRSTASESRLGAWMQ